MQKLLDEINTYLENIEHFPGRFFYLKSLGIYSGVLYYDIENGILAGIPVEDDTKEIDENFNSCRLFTKFATKQTGGNEGKYIFLSCNNNSLKNHFAFFCQDFLDPGINGEKRKLILSDPYKWCLEWTSLLGNAVSDSQIYSTIAEMMVLDYVFKQDKTASWHSAQKGSHDIITNTSSAEVKASTKRDTHTVTIHGQFQLDGENPFYLYLIIFEKVDTQSETISLISIYNQLIKDGYDKSKLDSELAAQGINLRNHKCSETYWVHEKLRYLVDENFPKLDHSMLPKGIKVNEYQINLDETTIKPEQWN